MYEYVNIINLINRAKKLVQYCNGFNNTVKQLSLVNYSGFIVPSPPRAGRTTSANEQPARTQQRLLALYMCVSFLLMIFSLVVLIFYAMKIIHS